MFYEEIIGRDRRSRLYKGSLPLFGQEILDNGQFANLPAVRLEYADFDLYSPKRIRVGRGSDFFVFAVNNAIAVIVKPVDAASGKTSYGILGKCKSEKPDIFIMC